MNTLQQRILLDTDQFPGAIEIIVAVQYPRGSWHTATIFLDAKSARTQTLASIGEAVNRQVYAQLAALGYEAAQSKA
jgi:hypothetical protein